MAPSRTPGAVFVTGTDTGVGKTLVAAGLAAAWTRLGLDTGVMKPFASGSVRRGRRRVHEDVELLRRASGSRDPDELVVPVLLRPPLAPSVAARLSGVRVDPVRALRALRVLAGRHERLVVEGVGGLLVPVRDRWPVARFAAELRLPLIIVARASLGTINHTALTALAARVFGLEILGVVVSRTEPGRDGPAERTNPDAIRRETGLPILAVLPHLRGGPLSAAARRPFDLLARAVERRLRESAQ